MTIEFFDTALPDTSACSPFDARRDESAIARYTPAPPGMSARFVSALVVSVSLALGCGSGSSAPATTNDAGSTEETAVDAAVPKIPMPSGDLLSFKVDAVGPFNVGYRAIETTYTPPGQTMPRTIVVDVWYPSLDAEGENPRYLKLFRDADVFENASLAPPVDAKGYPVHVYSHGDNGFGGTSSDNAHWFASHGWVYVAPNHLGNTLGAGTGKRPVALYYMRSTDVSAAIDLLDKLPAGDPLAGKARTKHVIMSGHSYGAYTTWVSSGAIFDVEAIKAKCDKGEFIAPCTPAELAVFEKGVADARIVASIPMASGDSDFFKPESFDAAKRPVMLMTGSEDVSGQKVFDKVTTNDFIWLEFTGGCHQLFAVGGCAKFDEKLGWLLVNQWSFAYARRFLLGDASDRTSKIVSGEASLSEKIVFKRKGTLSPPSAF